LSLSIYSAALIIGFIQFESAPKAANHLDTLKEPDFCYVMVTNLRVTFLLLSGALLFGMTTAVNLVFNGLNLALAIKTLNGSMSLRKILLLILPHGIFEIPAIIIAGAAGFKIPYEVIRYLAGRKEVILTREDIKEYLTLALTSVILIVIAAWIEANVTLEIAKRLDMGR
jgi:uncharacterized membrane protein SpoIIM required for sporulation